MELYIGGRFQGKLSLAAQLNRNHIIIDENNIDLFLNIINDEAYYGFDNDSNTDNDSNADNDNNTLIINHLHLIIRRLLEKGLLKNNSSDMPLISPAIIIKAINIINTNNKNLVIICDEIGSGVVPIDEFERDYRELVGRTLIEIAKESEKVWRVLCQLRVQIK